MEAQLYPQVSANLGYSYQRSNISIETRGEALGITKDFYMGFSINYNLFNGYKTQKNIQLAELNIEAQQLKTEQLSQKLYTELAYYLQNYQQYLEQYLLAQKIVAVTKNTLDYWYTKQKAGLITSIELRNYQKNYLLNTNNQLNQWLKSYQTWIEIQSLCNGLVE
jgi:outer membrane protein TolC